MHTKYSEAVYVIEGEITVYRNKAIVILKPGQSFLISKGIPHLLVFTGLISAHALVIASPSGFAKLIRTLGTNEQVVAKDSLADEVLENFMQISE